jgi:hypothetical protein
VIGDPAATADIRLQTVQTATGPPQAERKAECARHGLYKERENNRARGVKATSASSGKMGR